MLAIQIHNLQVLNEGFSPISDTIHHGGIQSIVRAHGIWITKHYYGGLQSLVSAHSLQMVKSYHGVLQSLVRAHSL